MTLPTGESHPLRLQASIYAAAFFTGNLNPIMAVVMPLWALELGASPLVIGLIISSRQILTVTFSIHSGALMDRFGARLVIIVLGFAGAATLGLYPVLPFIWAAILLQMISGFAETTNWIGTQALVGQLLKGHAVYAGRMTASARAGGFVGPLLTGLVWEHIGPFGAFSFLAGWVLCGVVAAWFVPAVSAPYDGQLAAEEQEPRPTGARDVMPKLADYGTALRLLVIPAVVLVIAATLVRQTGSGIQSSFYGVWLSEIGFTGGMIGLLVGISNGVSAISALSIGPLTRRFGEHWLLILTVLLAIIPMAITPLLGTFGLLVAAIALRGVGQGLNLPLMMAIAARAVGLDLQGRVVALRITFNRFGGAMVPFAMGALAEAVGLETAFYVVGIAGVVLIGLLALWVARAPDFRGADR